MKITKKTLKSLNISLIITLLAIAMLTTLSFILVFPIIVTTMILSVLGVALIAQGVARLIASKKYNKSKQKSKQTNKLPLKKPKEANVRKIDLKISESDKNDLKLLKENLILEDKDVEYISNAYLSIKNSSNYKLSIKASPSVTFEHEEGWIFKIYLRINRETNSAFSGSMYLYSTTDLNIEYGALLRLSKNEIIDGNFYQYHTNTRYLSSFLGNINHDKLKWLIDMLPKNHIEKTLNKHDESLIKNCINDINSEFWEDSFKIGENLTFDEKILEILKVYDKCINIDLNENIGYPRGSNFY